MLASSGYIIIYTNPHGSSGRGVKFSDIRGRYGQIDFDDLMNFVNEAIKKYPQIDADKMGVYGGSYGGFMTNWTIGHTDRSVSYTHLTLPTTARRCRSRWSPYH